MTCPVLRFIFAERRGGDVGYGSQQGYHTRSRGRGTKRAACFFVVCHVVVVSRFILLKELKSSTRYSYCCAAGCAAQDTFLFVCFPVLLSDHMASYSVTPLTLLQYVHAGSTCCTRGTRALVNRFFKPASFCTLVANGRKITAGEGGSLIGR